MQKIVFSAAKNALVNEGDIDAAAALSIRKRVFSLDVTEFPGLDDLDKFENDQDLGSGLKGGKKHDSGVKYRSHVSTVDSFTAERLRIDEPLICEETDLHAA